ncbi:UNVERIFIED_CONTAM: 15-cis-zeta-carotene isomerase, chloroplastic [Sesamum calycinum]|uniref:15-cis-zeta-carotene isomerase, chloroplastic n=1 Tax=Sesamum calycinum TaxID=2727403 RepID=A0AAW2QM80_9LAMI
MASSVLLSHPLSSQLHLPKRNLLSPNRSRFPCFYLKTADQCKSFNARLPNRPAKLKNFVLHVAKTDVEGREGSQLVGEDSAVFELSKQKISSWVYFTGILGVVLYVLNVVWIDNSTGFGKVFIDALSSVSDSPEVVMLLLTLIFAIVHSGLASLRDTGEKLIGERAFRVLFAGVSLPLAVSTVVYFINHRYDGVQLWQLQGVPGLHELLWVSNFISFFFLYPSTFNLLEVAAVDKPKMHLWETGIMRITRHPQMVGQVMWCLAHTIWIGNSVAVAASVGLIAHHLFGVWNGDRRLAIRYGEAFEAVKNRTSVIPFAAILDGRQKLPDDYFKEFLRLPYLSITALTLGAYFAHPLMQAGSSGLHCEPYALGCCIEAEGREHFIRPWLTATKTCFYRGQDGACVHCLPSYRWMLQVGVAYAHRLPTISAHVHIMRNRLPSSTKSCMHALMLPRY